MYQVLWFFFILTYLPAFSYAEEEAVDIYAESVEALEPLSGQTQDYSVEDFFSEAARFNYFEEQALRASGSLFVEGIDQRFLELKYNGFSLRDPSTPSGVFNVNSLRGVNRAQIKLTKSSSLEISKKEEEALSLLVKASHLGEGEVKVDKGACNFKSCQTYGVNLKRGGGFSQSSQGVEDDYFEEINLNFSNNFFTKSNNFKTHILYYGQRLDEDNVFALPDLNLESRNAESKNSVFLMGQEASFDKTVKLKLSFLSSYRNQIDPSQNTSFRQRGEVLEASFEFIKYFKLELFRESFNLYSSKGVDLGLALSHESSFKNFNFKTRAGESKERGLNWSIEAGFKNFVLFYKGVTPSLFQNIFNESFASFKPSLESQKVLGLRFFKLFKIKKLNVKFNQSYSYFDDFIDFNLISNSYENLQSLENIFSSLDLRFKSTSFFIQHQISRQRKGLKEDLPRRPRWTLGLRHKQKVKNLINIYMSIKWLSERPAFDQSTLKEALLTELQFEYRSFKLSATNVLNEERELFRELSRRPLTVSLSYQKKL